MNYTKKPKSLLAQIKNDIQDAVSFTIEFYKQKPHWDTEYYDVFSGCKESFEDYRNKVLTEKFVVKASFELKDFENAIFRFAYKNYKINPTEIAYIKIIDDANIFQGKSWYNTYFFVINVSFTSTEIAIFQAQLDFWMTYWEKFSFNGKMIKCLRKHIPRYRTDEGHIGEYDFSTNSCVLNIDQIEGQYTNLVSTQNYYLYAFGFNTFYNMINNNKFAYGMAIPKDSDSVCTGLSSITPPKLKWQSFKNIKDNKDNLNLAYFFIDNNPLGTRNKSPIISFPYFVFGLSNDTISKNVFINLKSYTTSFGPRETYITYDYKILSYLGNNSISTFLTDHPIFEYKNLPKDKLEVHNLVYIDGISNNIQENLDIQEICCYDMTNFKNKEWLYKIEDKFLTNFYYKPLKEYLEIDKLSLDQEPALFRTPHFEFEYTILDVKGFYKVYNELLLRDGYFDNYGNLYCDYILHYTTLQKYIYVKNGWYEAQAPLWRIGLIEENFYGLDLISEAYTKFIQENLNRFNTSYTQTLANSFLGIAEGAVGMLAAPFTGGLSAGIGIGAGLSFMNNIKNATFAAMTRQAEIKDLQRSPSTRVNPSGNFANTASNQMQDWTKSQRHGYLLIRQHRENEQWILYMHFHRNGYLVHKLLEVPSLSWFYSRHWFDYFQIEDFSTVLDNTKYSQYILNKFNNIFHRGVRLWHTTDHFLDYSLNNKEIDGWKEIYLKK